VSALRWRAVLAVDQPLHGAGAEIEQVDVDGGQRRVE